MKIKPLNLELLNQSVKLIDDIFPDENDPYDDPKIWIPAGINYEKYKNLFIKTQTTYIQYWCAVEDNKVLGIIGLYTEKLDEKDTIRISWFGVNKNHRGKGIGKKLLNFIFEYSKILGKDKIKVYTDPKNKVEKSAQFLYEKFGLKRNIEAEKNLHRDDVILREYKFK